MLATLRRVGVTLTVLVIAVGLNFVIPRMMPGSPLRAIARGGDAGQLTGAQREELLERYGLDDPLSVQLRDYVVGLFRGDLGISLGDGRPVTEHITDAIGWTMLLVGTSLVLTTVLGVALGTWFTMSSRRGADRGGLVTSLALDALPPFWFGMLLILGFGVGLGWFPTFGATSIVGGGGIVDIAHHLVLPVATLVVTGLGQTYLVTRSSLLGVMGSTHVAHSRVRGLPERRIRAHALRAAALPIHTLVLLEVGWLISGSVVVETVFAYPGLGRTVFEAVQARDYPLLQGSFLLLTLTVIGANLIADLTYPLIDPRVRGATAS